MSKYLNNEDMTQNKFSVVFIVKKHFDVNLVVYLDVATWGL